MSSSSRYSSTTGSSNPGTTDTPWRLHRRLNLRSKSTGRDLSGSRFQDVMNVYSRPSNTDDTTHHRRHDDISSTHHVTMTAFWRAAGLN